MIALSRIFIPAPIGAAGDPEGAATQRPEGVGPLGLKEYFSLVYGVRKWRISGVDTRILPYEAEIGWDPETFETGTWEVEITPQKEVYVGEEPNPSYDPSSPTDPDDPDYVELWATEFLPVYALVPIEQGEELGLYSASISASSFEYSGSVLSPPTTAQPSGWKWSGEVPVYGADGGEWSILLVVDFSWVGDNSPFSPHQQFFTAAEAGALWCPFRIEIIPKNPPIPVWGNVGTSTSEDATTGTLTVGGTELAMYFRITNSEYFQLPGHYRVANAEAIEWWSYGGTVNTETGALVES